MLKGDKIVLLTNMDGNTNFYITEHVRTSGLLWLALIFAGLVLLVGKKQGGEVINSLSYFFCHYHAYGITLDFTWL